MIVDSSAIVAMVLMEPEAERLAMALATEGGARISAATMVEVYVVIDNLKSAAATKRLSDVQREMGLEIEPLTQAQVEIARQANLKFGRRSGHPAKLNFGDCFSYALAIDKKEPLLFKGHDFSQTDVLVAAY